MKIVDVVTSCGLTGFYFDDQRAIKRDAQSDGFTYKGEPVTEGFTAIRQQGESLSVMLILEDGQVAYGDCAAVQYSGAGGRDPLFLAKDFQPIVEDLIKPLLLGRELKSFKELAEEIDNLRKPDGKLIHTALRYGVTQAILDAVAKSKKITMAEVIAEEYNTELQREPIPIFTQSGDERYLNVDKMIIKGADVMPHGLINNVKSKLGEQGEKLKEYIVWMKNRVKELNKHDKLPIFHLDVYGTIGLAFDNDYEKMAKYLLELGEVAKPHKLRIEGPMDMEDKYLQMEALEKLNNILKQYESNVEIVADEWCNTLEDIKDFADRKCCDMVQIKTPDLGGINNIIEAVLYCKEKGVGAYLGGTCNETDRSAQIAVHIALATGPDQILAKPGMGVDEGLMIVKNEMMRTLALLNRKKSN
ncbi:methylaspartate ammonia-lyase [Anaerobranca gottschalkii]|uniref:methylaspartate ammonia-lyase n=1 Tax=Anaerobranca gottschalkii DSM 13577 TaxID=1120990 RepID=A0A1I0AFV7_9FIRM|nr:methylaspartate ammonia-lyase [Anaerobranca gottschalkii]SES93122.1 methylaspartate ammonia-lyase [Anaerobranca gottschalkii DSM 13577]